MRELNRLEPQMPAAAYKTYAVSRPAATHWRTVSCQAVECPNHLRGWRITIDLSTKVGQEQARYIRDHSGRKYEKVIQSGTLVTLEFPAGQQCFTEHRIPLDREPLYLVKGGDYRGNPLHIATQRRSARSWVDDFGEHQQRLADEIRKG